MAIEISDNFILAIVAVILIALAIFTRSGRKKLEKWEAERAAAKTSERAELDGKTFVEFKDTSIRAQYFKIALFRLEIQFPAEFNLAGISVYDASNGNELDEEYFCTQIVEEHTTAGITKLICAVMVPEKIVLDMLKAKVTLEKEFMHTIITSFKVKEN